MWIVIKMQYEILYNRVNPVKADRIVLHAHTFRKVEELFKSRFENARIVYIKELGESLT